MERKNGLSKHYVNKVNFCGSDEYDSRIRYRSHTSRWIHLDNLSAPDEEAEILDFYLNEEGTKLEAFVYQVNKFAKKKKIQNLAEV